jgi:hypothetical protein
MCADHAMEEASEKTIPAKGFLFLFLQPHEAEGKRTQERKFWKCTKLQNKGINNAVHASHTTCT